MNFHILTLFPEAIVGGLYHSIIKRAIDEKKISINCVNIRDFAGNKHNRVDDYPYGGGAGMLIRAEPVYESFNSIKKNLSKNNKVIYLTPQGDKFSQKKAKEYSKLDDLTIICGHYEGIDERVIEEIVDEEISIGDFILTGGEVAANVIIDAISRLIPSVLGKEESFMDESFSDGLLEYPQYTRPSEFLGKKVPAVLLSGNHAEIDKWRKEQSYLRTKIKRPDLLWFCSKKWLSSLFRVLGRVYIN